MTARRPLGSRLLAAHILDHDRAERDTERATLFVGIFSTAVIMAAVGIVIAIAWILS